MQSTPGNLRGPVIALELPGTLRGKRALRFSPPGARSRDLPSPLPNPGREAEDRRKLGKLGSQVEIETRLPDARSLLCPNGAGVEKAQRWQKEGSLSDLSREKEPPCPAQRTGALGAMESSCPFPPVQRRFIDEPCHHPSSVIFLNCKNLTELLTSKEFNIWQPESPSYPNYKACSNGAVF